MNQAKSEAKKGNDKTKSLLNGLAFLKNMITGFLAETDEYSKHYFRNFVETWKKKNPNYYEEFKAIALDETSGLADLFDDLNIDFPYKEADMLGGKNFVGNLTNEQAKRLLLFFDKD